MPLMSGPVKATWKSGAVVEALLFFIVSDPNLFSLNMKGHAHEPNNCIDAGLIYDQLHKTEDAHVNEWKARAVDEESIMEIAGTRLSPELPSEKSMLRKIRSKSFRNRKTACILAHISSPVWHEQILQCSDSEFRVFSEPCCVGLEHLILFPL